MATDEIPLAFALTDSDRRNPLWLRLREYLETELKNKRGKNDGPLDPLETATIRGHIAFLKAFLALGTEPPITGG
jgi:hypothetical protein